MAYDVPLVSAYSPLLYPRNYPDFASWLAAVQVRGPEGAVGAKRPRRRVLDPAGVGLTAPPRSWQSWRVCAAAQATWDATWAECHACTAPVPADGPYLAAISAAKPEPVVAHRAWALRIACSGMGVAYVAYQLLRRRL